MLSMFLPSDLSKNIYNTNLAIEQVHQKLQQQTDMQHRLPQIAIRHHPTSHQPSIHSLTRQQRKSINSKLLTIKNSLIVNNNTPLHQYVRMSFSNKTVVYKKRLVNEDKYNRENIAPMSVHQSNQIVIVKSSPRIKTDPGDSELRGCKSLLNTKVKEKKIVFDVPKKFSLKIKDHEHSTSLMDIGVSNKIGRPSIKTEQFELLPWENQQTTLQPKDLKEDRVLRPIRRFF